MKKQIVVIALAAGALFFFGISFSLSGLYLKERNNAPAPEFVTKEHTLPVAKGDRPTAGPRICGIIGPRCGPSEGMFGDGVPPGTTSAGGIRIRRAASKTIRREKR